MRKRAIGGVGVLLLVALGVGRQAQAAEPCDRACLEGFVNQYLDALAAHDSSKLPLTENARYTENGQTLKLNDGMWGPRVTLAKQAVELDLCWRNYGQKYRGNDAAQGDPFPHA